MNKLMMIPITALLLLTLYGIVYTGLTYSGDTYDFEESGEIVVNETTQRATLVQTGEPTIDIWDIAGAIVVLIIAVTLGWASGIQFFGSGLNDTASNIVFNASLFLGLWGCLTILVNDFLFYDIMMMIFWWILTVMFTIGVGMNITGGDASQ